ncbi:MAG: hypothetical protein Q8N51_19155 [Gammaproteobacteria bacterium]|nr:hypothetical protein [Gammaproteobacteria bacterium]
MIEMFRYAFCRIYAHQRCKGYSDPLFGAVLGWATYVMTVFIPLIPIVVASRLRWVPEAVMAHPARTGMVVGAALTLLAYVMWVKNGVYATLDDLYGGEPHGLKRARAILFWLWPLLGLILFVYYVKGGPYYSGFS